MPGKEGLAELQRIFGERHVEDGGHHTYIIKEECTRQITTDSPALYRQLHRDYIQLAESTLEKFFNDYGLVAVHPPHFSVVNSPTLDKSSLWCMVGAEAIESPAFIAKLKEIPAGSYDDFLWGKEERAVQTLKTLNSLSPDTKWHLMQTDGALAGDHYRTVTKVKSPRDAALVIKAIIKPKHPMVIPPDGEGFLTIPFEALTPSHLPALREINIAHHLKAAGPERSR